MKKCFTVFCLLAAVVGLQAADVQFNLRKFTSGVVTNRAVTLTPVDLIVPAGVIPSYDPITFKSDGTGTLTISNAYGGLYTACLLAPPGPPQPQPDGNCFYINVPTNSGLVLADTIKVVSTNAVTPSGQFAYTQSASDARYATQAQMANAVTNGQTGPTFNTLRVDSSDSDGIKLLRGSDPTWKFTGGNLYGYDGYDDNGDLHVAITIDSVGDVVSYGGDAVFYRFYGLYFGGAAGLTNGNASTFFGTGTVPASRLPLSYTNIVTYNTQYGDTLLFQDDVTGGTVTYYNGELDGQVGFHFSDAIFGGSFYGYGDGITRLNASELATGTVPAARLPQPQTNSVSDIGHPALNNGYAGYATNGNIVVSGFSGVNGVNLFQWQTLFITNTSATVPTPIRLILPASIKGANASSLYITQAAIVSFCVYPGPIGGSNFVFTCTK